MSRASPFVSGQNVRAVATLFQQLTRPQIRARIEIQYRASDKTAICVIPEDIQRPNNTFTSVRHEWPTNSGRQPQEKIVLYFLKKASLKDTAQIVDNLEGY